MLVIHFMVSAGCPQPKTDGAGAGIHNIEWRMIMGLYDLTFYETL